MDIKVAKSHDCRPRFLRTQHERSSGRAFWTMSEIRPIATYRIAAGIENDSPAGKPLYAIGH